MRNEITSALLGAKPHEVAQAGHAVVVACDHVEAALRRTARTLRVTDMAIDDEQSQHLFGARRRRERTSAFGEAVCAYEETVSESATVASSPPENDARVEDVTNARVRFLLGRAARLETLANHIERIGGLQ
jgi:hypothetical protein